VRKQKKSGFGLFTLQHNILTRLGKQNSLNF
jgi:hypothetical protein